MIRTNLATRPFYNEGAVRLVLAAAALLVLLATAFNVTRIVKFSRSDTELASAAARDEAKAAELHAAALRLRASVNPKQVEAASVDARQANDLIDRRTFSWTDLLNRFEVTLPDDVRITAMRPKLDRKRGFVLMVNVVAKGVDDVAKFMESLEATGAFIDVISHEEQINEQGLLESQLEAIYVPSSAHPSGQGTGGQ